MKDQPNGAGEARSAAARAPDPLAPVPLAEAALRLGGDLRTWRDASRAFPVRWPRAYLELAERPEGAAIRRMGVPSRGELEADPGDLADPVGERGRSDVPFVIRKHRDRALLLVTARCHFYCRFCFRRSFPTGEHRDPTRAQLAVALDHLRGESDLREVILSGGDPLVLDDSRLASILGEIADMPQVERIRIHSRAPIHAPARVTQALAALLASTPKPLRVVTHANHPSELGEDATRALALLRSSDIELLNQSVLLAGVNDDVAVLDELMDAIVARGVTPYYLHHPDRAAGNATFRVSIEQGLALMTALARRREGEPMPTYVIDVPDGSGKVPVSDLVRVSERRYRAPHGFEWQE